MSYTFNLYKAECKVYLKFKLKKTQSASSSQTGQSLYSMYDMTTDCTANWSNEFTAAKISSYYGKMLIPICFQYEF